MTDTLSRTELAAYKTLYEFSHKLSEQADLTSILQALVDSVLELTGADQAILFEMNGTQPEVRVACMGEGSKVKTTSFSESVLQMVLESGQPLLRHDALNDQDLSAHDSVANLSIRSVICVPLHSSQAITGLLYVSNQHHADLFSERHLELLNIFARQAGLLIAEALRYEALRESEERYRALVEAFPESLLVCRGESIIFANTIAIELLGATSEEEVVGRPLRQFVRVHGKGGGEAERFWQGVREQRAQETAEGELQRLDHGRVSVEVTVKPIVLGGETVMQVVCRDVTHKLRMLAERMRLDRLVAMGTLAAGMGHEINNPLSFVMTNIDYALHTLREVGHRYERCRQHGEAIEVHELEEPMAMLRDARDGLEAAHRGTVRICDVVRSMQSFSRLETDAIGALDVAEPLEFAINVARSEIRHRARLVSNLEATRLVAGNESRLGQVFLNILINAAQAIPPGDNEANEVRIRSYDTSANVVVEIHDSGEGIAPELLGHIFEPFVTTKSSAEGTGLGLSICRDIVERTGGRIEVESERGVGTCFRIVLPYASRAMQTPNGATALHAIDNE